VAQSFFVQLFRQHNTDDRVIHPYIVQIPKKGKIYSVNEGNAQNWDAAVAKYVPSMFS
jgi:fructose-1,6-bisphosphatase